jgi:hypothetical protein
MGDGSKAGKGLILCTDSYSLNEIIILMNILKLKFDIDSSIHYHTSLSPHNYIIKRCTPYRAEPVLLRQPSSTGKGSEAYPLKDGNGAVQPLLDTPSVACKGCRSQRIYINKKNLNIIKPFIKPYFVNSMLYKID